ncbi:MAG: tetratricopeptide repeat protein [Deltaproteobacteria bacterium]|nr:tetratricopeptide repeat protein [Deltaproteobacteria bacterium]
MGPLCALGLGAPACKTSPPAEVSAPAPAAAPAQATPPAASVSQLKAVDTSDSVTKRPKQLPPATPCLDGPGARDPSVPDLLEKAAQKFEQGRYDESLECAREASRLDPQSLAAHHVRGAALSELGEVDEARTAYARALALDPDDPEVLRSAADLYVRRMGGRDDLELALAYVQRAFPRATKSKDKQLLKELYLLQAMALDDLGRPGEALIAGTKAVDYDPKDREARREKGVALFELCRFEQSKAELEKLSAEEPDAWAEHYLGLIAERVGDEGLAQKHFKRAQELDADAFKPGPPAPAPVFAQMVKEEVEHLPPDIKAGLSKSQLTIEDLPEVADLVATDPPLSPGILGLFRPPPDGAPVDSKPTIILYRKNLARASRNPDELRREVRDTLLHEVGHLNGEDDDQLRDRGL